ncbi:hypothetical protein HYDPIDRAFT_106781 [Hydnomerulius pinastri MD-312]|nr:hypothetical protein HYDPIDRAFT_106781 [Hydnomerulius pinastri MD-312]
MSSPKRKANRGIYRLAAIERADDEENLNHQPEAPEIEIPGRISRNASEESLKSTKSSVYSGLEDLTEVMNEVPLEVLHGGPTRVISSSSFLATDVPPSRSIVPPSSSSLGTSEPSGSGLSSGSSDADSVLGKRKSSFTEPASLSLSSPPQTAQTDEQPYIIAHHQHLQRVFDHKRVPFGVQWMVARLVTLEKIKYEGISVSDIDKLRGSNEHSAPLVERFFGGSNGDGGLGGLFDREKAATSPWKELDRERECTSVGFHRQPDGWYGGKVHFSAVVKVPDGDKKGSSNLADYQICLNRPELGPSSRLSRHFGSHAILRIRIPRAILNRTQSSSVKFFSQRFLLCGIVYRAFHAKDSTVFLAATDECFGAAGLPYHARPRPPSFVEFLDWHNPILLNSSQTMAKWASRFALGLSNSVPGITIAQTNIFDLEDKVMSGSDMTDGAGYINLAAMRLLRQLFDWEAVPAAIQCRIKGAKGLLLLHPDFVENESITPCVWLRPSQIKIKYSMDQPLPVSQVTLDVLRSSHLRTPSRLAAETIVNLAENGVPHWVFIDLMKENLDAIVDSLLDWEGSDAMFRLWHAVARAGGVIATRMARETAGEARMRGYFVKDIEEEDEDDLDGQDDPQSSAWWGDETSGCPSSLEETILVLLDAGFTPQGCPLLAEKLKSVIKTQVEKYVHRYRLEVSMSCIAWIVPDPSGTLAPDEVQILSRDARLLQPDGTKTHAVLGDVLLTRHPCKLPTDVQKVKAVMKPELQQYTDVIVCSVQGTRRFADLLAGGDYDGDKAIAIWQPSIVATFRNAPLHYSYPPNNLAGNFKKETCLASDFIKQHSHHLESMVPGMQTFLLAGLQDISSVGKYSNFHDVAIYTLGYAHPETIRLAYMFCNILDGAKSGLTVLPEVIKNDTRKFQKRAPVWKENPDDAARESNELNILRPASLSTFIMDTIFTHAKEYRDVKLFKVERSFPTVTSKDSMLLKPWADAEERLQRLRAQDPNHAARMRMELSRLHTHVDVMYGEYKTKVRRSFTDLRIERRQDILRGLAQRFARSPDPSSFLCFSEEELAHLKASCAYKVDGNNGRFAFSVAMRELGYIKARALGPTKTVMLGFYDRFVVKQSFPR